MAGRGRRQAVQSRPDEPLRDDTDDGVGQQEGFDPHVEKTRDGRGGTVRVQGADDEMPGDGGLHRDGGRLIVPDLTDHDNVRVLAEDGAERGGKGQAGLRIDLHLVDAGYVRLDRVLDV